MASLAEIMTGSALESSQRAGAGLPDAVVKGIGLAQHADELRIKRDTLEADKKKVNAAKEEQLYNMFVAAQKMDPKAQKMFLSKEGPFRKHRDAIGKTQDYPDDKLEWIGLTPENMAKARGVIEDARNGKIDTKVAMSIIFDESKYPDLQPFHESLSKEVQEAGKQYLNMKTELQKQQNQITATKNEKALERTEAGNVEVRKKTGDLYTKFKAGGSEAGMRAQIAKLDRIEEQLLNNEIVTGGKAATIAQGVLGDTGLALVNKNLKAAQDTVRNSISLKGSLDSQFSAKEAEMAYSQKGLDVKLTNKQNIQKIRDLRDELNNNLNSAISEFQAQGFMPQGAGEVPPDMSLSDNAKAMRDLITKDPAKMMSRLQKAAADPRFNTTPEELAKKLGIRLPTPTGR